MIESPYWVWERSDGYIGYSRGVHPDRFSSRDTFKVLYQSDTWDTTIVEFVESARTASEKHQSLVKSWHEES